MPCISVPALMPLRWVSKSAFQLALLSCLNWILLSTVNRVQLMLSTGYYHWNSIQVSSIRVNSIHWIGSITMCQPSWWFIEWEKMYHIGPYYSQSSGTGDLPMPDDARSPCASYSASIITNTPKWLVVTMWSYCVLATAVRYTAVASIREFCKQTHIIRSVRISGFF